MLQPDRDVAGELCIDYLSTEAFEATMLCNLFPTVSVFTTSFASHVTGCATNASRNAIVNVSEIVCYDIIKEAIITNGLLKDGIPCHFTSAVIAGAFSLPFSLSENTHLCLAQSL